MKKIRITLVCVGCIALVLVGWCLWTIPRYDLSAVEPRLIRLTTPYQRVECSYFMDGGSVGIEILDHNGQQEQFALPAHMGEPNPYSKVFVGAMYDRRPGATLVHDSLATKQMLIQVLIDSRNLNPDADFSLAVLRGSPADYARAAFRRLNED